MTLEPSHLIAITGLLLTIMTTAIGLALKTQARLAGIEERVNTLETRMGLFWRVIEEKVSLMFKLPTHYRMDELLDRFSRREISYDESRELHRLLQERLTYPDMSPERRAWGDFVLKGIESYQLELERRARPRASWWTRVVQRWRAFWVNT